VCTQADVVHFVENKTGGGAGIHVNLTWHSATDVEDIIVSWDEQSDEAKVHPTQSSAADIARQIAVVPELLNSQRAN
jgi:hypothetical protein